jgi:iron complex outermembrane receptor protein
MIRLKKSHQITLSILASLPSTAVVVQAQPGESGARPALEEVVVTAQRREEDLQSAPVSVVALGAGRIAELGVNDPQALADFVPNLSMGDGTGRGSGGTSISIRGVNESRVSPVLDPAVGIYIDDVYYGRPQTSFLKLIDVERVEVLRGPQGTLFGKNSTGGAIRYVTQKPDFDEPKGYIKTTFGNFNRQDVKGAVNLPVSDTFAVRVGAASMSRDGFLSQIGGGPALGTEDTNFGSVQLRWAPTDRLDMHFGMDYTDRNADDGPTKIIDYFGFNGANDRARSSGPSDWNGVWGGTSLAYNPSIPNDLYSVGPGGLQTSNDAESLGAVFNLTYDLSDSVTLKSITGYRNVDERVNRDPDGQATGITFFDDSAEEGTEFFSQELQLSGSAIDNRLLWTAGLYYSSDEPYRIEIADRDGRNNSANGVVQLNDAAFQETESYGIYAQGTYDLTEKLAVTLGVRYTEEEKTFSVSQVAVWDFALERLGNELGVGPFSPPRGVCDPRITGSCVNQEPITGGETFTDVSPRFAVEYQWTDDIMTYASVSKGFKSGGVNDTVADIDTPFDPEELWAYEVGVRSELLDNRVRLNVTAFTMDYTDKQITIAPSDDNDSVCFNRCTDNVGDATITGWELESIFALTDGFTLHASAGGLDAAWDTVQPGAGINVDSSFARAPDLSYTIGGRYNYDLSSGAMVVATVDFAHTDDQESSPQDTTTLTIPAYDLMTARIRFTTADGNWNVSLFCTNCFDEEYITGGAAWAGATDNSPFNFRNSDTHPAFAANGGTVTNPNGVAPPGITLVNVGMPRMIGVDLKYDF